MQESAQKLNGDLFYRYGYIMLPVKLEIKSSINIQNTEFIAKKDFHISILAVKNYITALAEELKITEEQATGDLITEVDKFVLTNPLKLESISKDVRFVESGEKKSIVVLVNVSNIESLFSHLNNVFHIQFDLQPTHITLYTLSNGLGIGINGQAALDTLSKKLDEFESKLILDSFEIEI